MKLIVGLGNPGKNYERTRHNVGFFILNELIKEENVTLKSTAKLRSDVYKGQINKRMTVLAKPQTFMNSSGEAVAALINFYKIPIENLIIVQDDKDIPLGTMRIQADRGSAGHNGIKSIAEYLGTQNFLRIRVGVAPLEGEILDTANFVLSKFTAEEQKKLKEVTANVIEEIKKRL